MACREGGRGEGGQGLTERRILIEDLQYMLLGYESFFLLSSSSTLTLRIFKVL